MKLFRVYPARNYPAGGFGPHPLALVRLTRMVPHRRPDGLVRYQARPACVRPPSPLPTSAGRGRFVPSRPAAWRRWGTAIIHELATGFRLIADWDYLLLNPLAALGEAFNYHCAAQSPAGLAFLAAPGPAQRPSLVHSYFFRLALLLSRCGSALTDPDNQR